MNALDAAFRFHETALKVGSQRQQVIASNMANADTPGYKASEVNFADALARATGESTSGGVKPMQVALHATHAGHIDGGASNGAVVLSTADLRQASSNQPSIDGNTVDLDSERAAFADNTVRYEASFTFLNHDIKQLMTAVSS
jgi:flagellar basal-body rod protein FlgB